MLAGTHTEHQMRKDNWIQLMDIQSTQYYCGRSVGLMINMLDSRSSGLGSSPGWVYCALFSNESLYSQLGTGEVTLKCMD